MYEGSVTKICIAWAVNIVQTVIALTWYIWRFLVFSQKALYESIKKACLIASNGKYVIGFCLVDYESSNNWRIFHKNFNEPEYVVCDEQNGLIQKYKDVYFMCKRTLNKS